MGKVLWKDGEWVIDGDPPNGLQFIDGQFRASDGSPQPECFGELWDGVGPRAAVECKQECDFSPCCMELTARQALPAAQIRLGAGHSLQDLAGENAMNISEESILALMAYVKGGANPAPIKEEKPKKKKAPPPDPEPMKAAEPPPPVQEASKVEPPKQEPSAEAPKAEVSPVSKKKATKKAPTKPAKGKKAEKAKAGGPGPQKAPSAKRAKAGAGAKVKATPVKPAKARAGSTPSKHWGEHTFKDRWERERERSPLIGQLKAGMVLKKVYKDQKCECRVLKMGYSVKGETVPTLYMTVLPYTGTVARPRQSPDGKPVEGERQVGNYSAAKFWDLEKLFGKPAKKAAKKAATKTKKAVKPKAQKEATPAQEAPVQEAPPPAPVSSEPPPLPPEAQTSSDS
jgi:hypothetical protein